MEQVIEFIEQYWGVTVAGGVTLGSIISFVIVQIKYILQAKTKDVEIQGLIQSVKSSVNLSKDIKDETHKELEAILQGKQIVLEENKYLKDTQAVMFKAISYLVIASKLPIEEKLALQEDFVRLKERNINIEQIHTKEPVVPVVPEVVEKEEESIFDNVKEVVEKTKSLLDKYASKDV
jgi:integrase